MTDPEEVAPAFGIDGEPEIHGDPDEMLEEATERLEYLESVWETVEETDPQQQVVALEIVALRRVIESIEAGGE